MILLLLLRVRILILAVLLVSPPVASYSELSDDTLRGIPSPGSDFNIHNGALLAPILIPRVPGSDGSTKVLQHFVDFFSTRLPLWRVEFQNSTSKTPLTGDRQVPFRNLIATRDPPWSQAGNVGRLALVAHYDSKIEPEGFIGATDSAAPCAILLHTARSIDAALSKKWSAMQASGHTSDGLEADRGVQIILLDGEEAFSSWTDTDSLYGARSLAEEWEHTFHPALSIYDNAISSISLFVLLDLLGSARPTVPSYFKTTHWAYKALATLEVRLRKLRKFKSSPNYDSGGASEPLFLIDAAKPDKAFLRPYIGDDHIPFMARGVEVLHLIPTPFPRVWHRMEDDGEHLDIDTVEDWARLLTAFAMEWMDVEGFFTSPVGNSVVAAKQRSEVGHTVSERSEL